LREIRKFKAVYFLSTPHCWCCPHRWYCRLHHCPGTPHRRWRLPILCAWGPCSNDWVRSAERRLVYGHTSLHARDVVKRVWLSLCTKEKLLQFCSQSLLYSFRAGTALLLLLLLPCSEQRWPSSHPGHVCTGCRTASSAVHLLPHKLDLCAGSAPWCGKHHLRRHACTTCSPPCAGATFSSM